MEIYNAIQCRFPFTLNDMSKTNKNSLTIVIGYTNPASKRKGLKSYFGPRQSHPATAAKHEEALKRRPDQLRTDSKWPMEVNGSMLLRSLKGALREVQLPEISAYCDSTRPPEKKDS